jgi:signal transduction histidine kinase
LTDPAPDREQEHAQLQRLADAIVRRRDEIEQRWLEHIRERVKREDVTPTELRNAMPDYLVRLADGLDSADTAQKGGTTSWKNVAREHADARVRLGFDIDQLVQDFIVLRQVIFGVLAEEGVGIDPHQAGRLADLIEGAIGAAVKSYVDSRDYELRKQASEHLGFITHELRNPLTTAILGATQLRRTMALTPEQARIFAVVDRNLRRVAELVDGVLLVERDAHALKPHPAQIALGHVLDEPVAAARLVAEAKGLNLEAHFDPELVVEVDPKLTISAIENVVQNAVKFTDHGNVSLDIEDHAWEVVVHVRDNGPGLTTEELRTIFEPFQRGESARGKAGSGLGLAIARRAVEVQGGSIHAESQQAGGCHFWLTLPKPRP